jgi:hypothetical protein
MELGGGGTRDKNNSLHDYVIIASHQRRARRDDFSVANLH